MTTLTVRESWTLEQRIIDCVFALVRWFYRPCASSSRFRSKPAQ
jgi:hypothetical protein